jgi:hypothetical protein
VEETKDALRMFSILSALAVAFPSDGDAIRVPVADSLLAGGHLKSFLETGGILDFVGHLRRRVKLSVEKGEEGRMVCKVVFSLSGSSRLMYPFPSRFSTFTVTFPVVWTEKRQSLRVHVGSIQSLEGSISAKPHSVPGGPPRTLYSDWFLNASSTLDTLIPFQKSQIGLDNTLFLFSCTYP